MKGSEITERLKVVQINHLIINVSCIKGRNCRNFFNE